MENVYVILPNDHPECEDIRIFLSKQDAINELLRIEKSLPDGHSYKDEWRIEIFKQENNKSVYTPSYKTLNLEGNEIEH